MAHQQERPEPRLLERIVVHDPRMPPAGHVNGHRNVIREYRLPGPHLGVSKDVHGSDRRCLRMAATVGAGPRIGRKASPHLRNARAGARRRTTHRRRHGGPGVGVTIKVPVVGRLGVPVPGRSEAVSAAWVSRARLSLITAVTVPSSAADRIATLPTGHASLHRSSSR
ncbi:hypothetical protein BAY61_26520 [Prauserella marina]|nr:hypothetical protein BAY61_26520 [Prauserella marina]